MIDRRGIFVLSLDTELAWGAVHHQGKARNDADYARTRAVIHEVLRLLERYEVRATWAVVGHLMLDRCAPESGVKHPDAARPAYAWFDGDWFDQDPCTDAHTDPFWYGPDIIAAILDCSAPQEIGSHGFSHMIIGDPGCTREVFASELSQSKAVAARWGVQPRSFVYPRNAIAHQDVLVEQGFTAYRGTAPAWHWRVPAPLRRGARFLDTILPITPANAMPVLEGRLCNVPATYFYLHRKGWARFVPMSIRVTKAVNALQKAARDGAMFHMWFHPFNLASDPARLLGGLETVLQTAATLRDSGLLVNETMGGLAAALMQATAMEKAE
jgi:peptidoglycan/xylan/chitin deacetylase (PgdA/CDA1 family)